ncbi:MAG: hypothetical protein EA425_16865, partial [Puniceicoccaceae bacterium]
EEIIEQAREQGRAIAEDLREGGASVDAESQMVALIAYLQALGTYESPEEGKERRAAARASAETDLTRR